MHGGVDKRPVQRGTYHGRSGGQAVGEREGEGFVYQDVGVQELGGVPRIAQADKGIVGVVDDGEVFGITQGRVSACALQACVAVEEVLLLPPQAERNSTHIPNVM